MDQKKILPIFPLDLVLFPRQQLPLRIFEPRYKQLVDDCMLSEGLFGVCLHDKSKTVTGWDAPHSVGTIAKITKCQDIDITSQNLYIETTGRSKFRIKDIIPPSISRPINYDPFSTDGLQRVAQLHEKSGTEKKMYIRAEVEFINEIDEKVPLEKWQQLAELWKQKIIAQAYPKKVQLSDLEMMLRHYDLLTETPTVDYIYSLCALGASSPNDLQPILEANSIEDLILRVEDLLIK
jgi:hypothetical protein